ncbi:acyl-CoA dehydrogenase, partial [Xanthomonas citri pv. citri]|nr:acyl-CoA dehydrogenase [Xanthomonas citri pv. citri]
DNAVESVNLAMQVHGGSGYIVESGIEQTLRDVRILPIYEGTNGVQAHDLLARKVLADEGGRLGQLLTLARAQADAAEAAGA